MARRRVCAHHRIYVQKTKLEDVRQVIKIKFLYTFIENVIRNTQSFRWLQNGIKDTEAKPRPSLQDVFDLSFISIPS